MFARVAVLHSRVEDAPTTACAPAGLFIVMEALTSRSNQNEIFILTMAHSDLAENDSLLTLHVCSETITGLIMEYTWR